MNSAMHSAERPDWGTPIVGKILAARVLAPAANSTWIDLDYATNAYWHAHWPEGMQPRFYLDGSRGRDVLLQKDRRNAVGAVCGAGFMNPPGLDGGKMVKKCWRLLVEDYLSDWLRSGVYVGFSLEQLASLQGAAPLHPLSPGVVTILPSRRGRYLLHPDQLIALYRKKLKKLKRGAASYKALDKKVKGLRSRTNDDPVVGAAPTHASFITCLLSKRKATRVQQLEQLRAFLDEQTHVDRSWFQKVAVIGADVPNGLFDATIARASRLLMETN